jgi:hypothetical protein
MVSHRLYVSSCVAVVNVLIATAACTGSARAAGAPCKSRLSPADHVIALNEVQNLMGRYSHLAEEHGEGSLQDLFAMKTEGVSWKSPRGPEGIEAMKARFAMPAEDPLHFPGQLHMHSMFTPVIEIAADGKTAQGVWDSFGPSVQTVAAGTGWLWVKYGVDFIKEDGQWKIWHLQVFPIFNTPYNTSLTDNAKAMAARAAAPPGPPAGAAPAADGPAAGPNGATMAMPGQKWTGPNDPLWIYDAKTPLRGPRVPEPYCTYDPSKSAAQYAPS